MALWKVDESRRRSDLFGLRSLLWLIVTLMLAFTPRSASASQWGVAVGFLVSSLVVLALPHRWFRNPVVGYALFFADIAGLTLLLRSVPGLNSESLLLFYLTVFMATAGETLKRGMAAAVVVTALFIWLHFAHTGTLLRTPSELLHVPLFFATAISCGYLAQEASRRERRVREQAASDLEESERRHRQLFQNNPQPMWIHDVETLAFLEVNQAAVEMYGHSREEFLRMKVPEICSPEGLPNILRGIARVASRTGVTSIATHITKTGKRMDVESFARPLTFMDKRAELVLIRDLSERRRAEEMLRSTNRALQTLIQASPLAIVTLDAEGNVKSWNSAAERLFGWNELELLECPLPTIPDSHREEFRELLKGVAQGQPVAGLEVRRRKKDGSYVDVALSAAPLSDPYEGLYGIVSIEADITKNKQMEESLRQAQKMEAVGRLAGGVAHDFNNLLTVIMGYTQVLLDRTPASNKEHGYLVEVEKAGERATSLTTQLLAFSRKQISQPQVMDLGASIGNMEKMLRRLIGEDIELVITHASDLGGIKADPGQIEQVIMNLAVNARDAMQAGGRLTIETANVELNGASTNGVADLKEGRYVLLAVSDTGCGMDLETRTHIFEPFFTTKKKGKGTGLGLATVYGIVTQGGGHIAVDSEPGKGSTFRIYLPAVSREVPKTTPSDRVEESLKRGSESVLLVEDEEPVRVLVRESLRACGYHVLEAHSSLEAITIAERYRKPIQLLLSDVRMPQMNGPEVAVRVKALHPEAEILFMSGYTDNAIPSREGEPAPPLLQKPFTPAALASKVREMLDAPRKPAGDCEPANTKGESERRRTSTL